MYLDDQPEGIKCPQCEGEVVTNALGCDRCFKAYHLVCTDLKDGDDLDGQFVWVCPTCRTPSPENVSPHGTTQPTIAQVGATPTGPPGAEDEGGESTNTDSCGGSNNDERVDDNDPESTTVRVSADTLAAMREQMRTMAAQIERNNEDRRRLAKAVDAKDVELRELKKMNEVRGKAGVGPQQAQQRQEPLHSTLRDDDDELMARVRRVMKETDALNAELNKRPDAARKTSSHTIDSTVRTIDETAGMDRLTALMSRQYIQKLPEFRGDEREWGTFKAVFLSTTEKGLFTESENVDRLRQALKGDAERMVKDLLTFSDSATKIMQYLERSFGRTDVLIVKWFKDILKLPEIARVNDPNLRRFAFEMASLVANVRSVSMDRELDNAFVLCQLTDKLSKTAYYREWSGRKRVDPSIGIAKFAEFLMEKVLEMPPDFASKETSTEKKDSRNPKGKSRPVLAHAQGGTSSTPTKGDCRFCCDSSHIVWKCKKFKEISTPDRWAFVKEKNLCYSCVNSTEHDSNNCPLKRKCGIGSCDAIHNRLLHYDVKTKTQKQETPKKPEFELNAGAAAFETKHVGVHEAPQLSHDQEGPTLFKIVPVKLYGNGKIVSTHAFLDGGSAITLIDKELNDELGLVGERETLELQWTKGITRKEESSRTSLSVSSVRDKRKFRLDDVFSIENLDLPEQNLSAKELKERCKDFRGLPLEDQVRAKPKIMIGLRHSALQVESRVHRDEDNNLIAAKTPLGWIVYGQASSDQGICHVNYHRPLEKGVISQYSAPSDDDLHNEVKEYFTVESFGVLPATHNIVSRDDRRALEIMERTLKKIDGRYEIGLLWKKDGITLPNSYPMAMKRLVMLEKTLAKKPELLQWKNDHMQSLLDKGYARIASDEELRQQWPRVWYPPTFVVVNPNKLPPKPRDVADVAAQVNGVSLNSNLLKGPDNIVSLLAGLYKFREGKVAVNADVREMFHQVRIIKEDQQCQRLLWRGGDSSKPPVTYIMQAMMFGPTCSPSCAQYVKNHHAGLFLDTCKEAAEALINTTFVDDYLNSHATEEKAFKVISDAIMICADMGFDLVGVQSNCLELLKKLPRQNLKPKMVDMDPSGPDADNYVTKILGMFWMPVQDYFSFKLLEEEIENILADENYQPTKRSVLRLIMKSWDPLGIVAHFLIHGRMILQQIWREGYDWDEPVSNELKKKFVKFLKNFKSLEKLQVTRHYSPGMDENSAVQLVVFVDASDEAYSAVAYFRFEAGDGSVHVSHVQGKARVAPLKQVSVPKLELMAAILGLRMAATIKRLHSFKIVSTKYLSDSSCVLDWINSTHCKFQPFVAARIGEIWEGSDLKEWWKVPTDENAADDATKEKNIDYGDINSRWYQGPKWLRDHEDTWPITQKPEVSDEIVKARMLVVERIDVAQTNRIDCVIDNISPKFKASWSSTVRVVARILRWKYGSGRQPGEMLKFITPKEFRRAEEMIFRKIQEEVFAHEVRNLKEFPERSVKADSKIRELSPFVDAKGVLRMSSRAQGARSSYAARNPAILPNNHPLVELLIEHYHVMNKHMSEETIIADLRESVWILNVRVAVRRAKKNCLACKLKKAKPVMPIMGQLPEGRLDFGVKPFTHVGMDCFGPLAVRQGRATVKRYGIIFTCLTYRAVYLELLFDLSLDQVMMAIRSLFARKGKAEFLYSDNGLNFVGCNNQMTKDLNELEAQFGEAAAKKFKVLWRFIPAYSPWMGGAWERLIQSIKKCIDFMLNGETPREDVLRAALVEAEFEMNRRPLTHTPIDHEDSAPLTPNTVMFGEKSNEEAASFIEPVQYSKLAYRRMQHLCDKYMRRWITEYLPEITRRSKWHKNTKPIAVGDPVIIVEPNDPKNAWRRGRVVKIYPGPDGVTRSADVMLPDRSIRSKRAVGRLAVLDVLEVSSA